MNKDEERAPITAVVPARAVLTEAEFFEHTNRTDVFRAGECDQTIQFNRPKGITDDHMSGLGCVSRVPILWLEFVPDLNIVAEVVALMPLAKLGQLDPAYSRIIPISRDQPLVETAAIRRQLDGTFSVSESLPAGQRSRVNELHDPRIGIERS